jgi:hypothetical protein
MADPRGLKLRLMALVLAWYVPLGLAFALLANAHGYFLLLGDGVALPQPTADFAFPVLGGTPGVHNDLESARTWVFYAFWAPLFLGPLAAALAIGRQVERARVVEVALQVSLAYGVFVATLFVALIGTMLLPFL